MGLGFKGFFFRIFLFFIDVVLVCFFCCFCVCYVVRFGLEFRWVFVGSKEDGFRVFCRVFLLRIFRFRFNFLSISYFLVVFIFYRFIVEYKFLSFFKFFKLIRVR